MPAGVVMSYWLHDAPKKGEVVTLEIVSGATVIRTLSSEKTATEGADVAEEGWWGDRPDKPLDVKAGLNRVVWDMRVLKPTLAPKAVFNEGEKAPPKVAPGTYGVRLKAAGQTLERTFEVTPNPTSPATRADLQAQFELLEAIRDALSRTHVTVMEIRDVRAQVTDLGARAKRLGKGDGLERRAAPLAEKLPAVELELINPEIKSDEDGLNYEPKLDHDFTYLAAVVASADRRPTAGSVQAFAELKARLDAIRGRFDALLAGDVAEFSRAAEEAKLPRIAPAPKID